MDAIDAAARHFSRYGEQHDEAVSVEFARSLQRKLEKLQPYLRHTLACAMLDPHEERAACTCGLDAAMGGNDA